MLRKYYTVYRKKDDEIIAQGTSKECAEQMNRPLTSFYSCVSKNRLGRVNTYDILVEELGDIEDEFNEKSLE